MEVKVFSDAEEVAGAAARFIAGEAKAAIAARGRLVMAVSGGSTPWIMLRHLAKEKLPWEAVHVAQVDERIAPAGDKDRNLTHLRETLLANVAIPEANIHAMPVEAEDLNEAAKQYAVSLQKVAGIPLRLDLVHLGLGGDGHTASLVPGDPVLSVPDADVAVTGPYQGRQRMTLTYPALDRARRVLWVVTGGEKENVLPRLMAADASIPAGRVSQAAATVFADRAAAAKLAGSPAVAR